jgi:hypothetical protein
MKDRQKASQLHIYIYERKLVKQHEIDARMQRQRKHSVHNVQSTNLGTSLPEPFTFKRKHSRRSDAANLSCAVINRFSLTAMNSNY